MRALRKEVIKNRVSAGDARELLALLDEPELLAIAAERIEVLASQKGDYDALAAFDSSGDDDLGFREIVSFIIRNWKDILPILLALLPLLKSRAQKRQES